MNQPVYKDIRTSYGLDTYYFNSIGKQGIIKKVVVYKQITKLANVFNLGFGTLKADNYGQQYIDGEDITDNGDIRKVLSTVAKTIEVFTNEYPKREVYFKGYTPRLTKLYQRAILNDYESISKIYSIWGNKDERIDFYDMELFNPLKTYHGFIVQKK